MRFGDKYHGGVPTDRLMSLRKRLPSVAELKERARVRAKLHRIRMYCDPAFDPARRAFKTYHYEPPPRRGTARVFLWLLVLLPFLAATQFGSFLKTHTTSAPSAPAAGAVEYWTNSADGQLWFTNSSGNSYPVGSFPKDEWGVIFVDTANTLGWAGADAGAWINSAYAYGNTTYGNASESGGFIIELAPCTPTHTMYTFSTPIVLGNASNLTCCWLRGKGDGNGATVLNFTGTSGAAISIGGGSGNDGGTQLSDFTLLGTAQGNGATGIQFGVSGVANAGGTTIKNVSIRRFTTGFGWLNSNSYAQHFFNCKAQQCTSGIKPTGENTVIFGGMIGNNATGLDGSTNPNDVEGFGIAFDDNTTTAVSESAASGRMTLNGCRFENAGLGTDVYVTISAGSVNMHGGTFQTDITAVGTGTGFVQSTGGSFQSIDVWHSIGSANRTMTQFYNVTAPGQVSLVNPVVAGNSATSWSGWFTAGVGVNNARMTGYTPGGNSLTAAIGTVNTTETLVVNLPVALNAIRVGTTLRFRMAGTFTTTTTAAQTTKFLIRSGTLGTVAGDTLNFTATITNGVTALTSQVFTAELVMTCTAVGTASTWTGHLAVNSPDGSIGGAAGFQGVVSSGWTIGTAPNLNTALFFDFSVQTSATTDSFTAITDGTAEMVRF